ncbi:hypothetical protein D3C79_688820 [compost metagenome]
MIHHQLPRHVGRRLCAEVLFNHRQRQIDAGADAGRGPEGTVANKNAVAVDANTRIALLQPCGVEPMGGGALAFQQPGGRQNKCPGTHAGHAPYLPALLLQHRDQRRGLRRRHVAAATGNQQRIKTTLLQWLGHHRHAGRTNHHPARLRHRQTTVCRGIGEPIGLLESRQRPRKIQQVKIGKDHKTDVFHYGVF